MRAAALAALCACALAGGEAVLHVRADVRLPAPRATIADVADIEAAPEVRERLAGIVVAELPALAPVAVDARLLTALAARAAAPDALRVVGQGTVSRAPRAFAAEELAAAAGAAAPAGSRWSLLRTGAQLTVPDGPDVRLVAEQLDPAAVGEVAFRVRAMDGAREVGRTLVALRVEREAGIVVAVRDIAAGAALTAQDLRVERRAVDRRTAQAATDPEPLVGLLARRAIRAGDPLHESMLARAPAVRAGSTVAVVFQGTGFAIELLATALSDARAGERLGLRRQSDGAILHGVARGDGTVVAER